MPAWLNPFCYPSGEREEDRGFYLRIRSGVASLGEAGRRKR